MSKDIFEKEGKKVGGGGDMRFVTVGDGPNQLPEFTGLYEGRAESEKYPGTINMYFREAGGTTAVVSGNAGLLERITEEGALYRITFTGKSTTKKGFRVKNFEVEMIPADRLAELGLLAQYEGSDPS